MRKDITERAYRFALTLTTLKPDPSYRQMIEREVLREIFKTGSSVGANLEEATGAQSKRDFIAKASIARKEALEVQFWLRLACDANFLSSAVGPQLLNEAVSIGRIVSSIVRNAKDERRLSH